MYFIYKHTTPDGKVYIGVTSRTPEERWKNGTSYKENEFFTKAIEEFGWENIKHEILFNIEDKNEAGKKEKELIATYNSCNLDYGYNIEPGGFSKYSHSEYTRRKISENLKGDKNPRFGKKFPNQKYGYCGKMTVAERLNRSLSHKGQVPVNKRKVCQYSKSGEQISLFESITEASKVTGITISNIYRCANGERKTAGGFLWKFN